MARSSLRLVLLTLLVLTPLLAARALAQDPRTGAHVRTDDARPSNAISQADQPSAEDSLTLVLRVVNQPRLRASDLLAAEEEATRIYKAAGIKTLWINPGAEAHDPEGEALHLRVLLLDRERAQHILTEVDLGADVLGRAARGTERVYIFSHRIAGVVADHSRKQVARGELSGDFSLVLGRVIAHELGHLLLPVHGHSETGIMRATMDLSNTPQRFTSDQVRLIHETIAADLSAHR